MRFVSFVSSGLRMLALLAACFALNTSHAQSNVNVRIMAANLNGNTQSYQPFAIRILQGTKADVVAIQEFNYTSTNGLGVNTPAAFREMIDTAFGTDFVYYREPFNNNGDIPNGIISRYPILTNSSWTDTQVANRGFAWAQIDLPGTNDLYIVSVHLLTSGATARSAEATNLKALIQSNFPSNAWIVVAGDFNTDSRTESTTMTTFGSYVSDFPVPVDNNGNSDTSQNRNHPHDYVLPSFAFTNFETATVFPSHSFPNGLVFDSAVYTPLSDVSPVQSGDSGQAQHMAVMKDFSIPAGGTTTNPPVITSQPQSQTNFVGLNTTFSVSATGSSPLSYQWFFSNTNISGATANTFTINNVQATNAGNYFVIVTNLYGSATSSVAALTVNLTSYIVTQPQSQTVNLSNNATFTAVAGGAAPLNYQWLFNGTNIPGAITNFYSITNAQLTNAGNYSLFVTNSSGSVTSSIAVLSVFTTQAVVIAQWNFNSVTPDGSTTTGSTPPSIGSGTASLIGGATATFATGDTSLDPAGSTDNSGWNTATYPAQGTGNKTRGAQFAVSTAGKQNIVVSWTSQSSNTGSKYGRLQYTTNGIDFVDFPTAFTNATSFTAKTNSLAAISGVNSNTNFAVRLVSEFESTAIGTVNANYVAAGTSYGTAGTMRYDMVTVSGVFINTNSTPAIVPTLGVPALTPGQLQFFLTGTTGATYIVQDSTNLASANWISRLTNTAPFAFTDLNTTLSQKFYRAVSSP